MAAIDDAGPERPRVLRGRYEITRLLGTGGMSEVHLGRDRELDRTVAIKLIPAEPHDNPEHGERLRREARAAAAIDHPNVVAVHDIGVSEAGSPPTESVFVVMEHLDGESLRSRVGRDGPLADDVAVTIAEQVCRALNAAHETGVIHRDISPGNIMLRGDDTVTVLDFGLARMAGSAFRTTTGEVRGTPAYIAPEQVQGGQLDARTDLYALGCCLYLMVTGDPPFPGTEAVAMAYQHVRSTPVPPREINPDVSPELQAVILRALAKDPDERHRSATHLRSELLSAVSAKTASPEDRTVNLSGSDGTKALPPQPPPQSDTGTPRTSTTDPDLDQEDSGAVRRWLGLAMIIAAAAVLLVVAGFAAYTVVMR
ncbi:protein kinase [Allosaccharopolyspora coralli]|uniref:non-specific serine/threonine protein kinase n=1 Tax=Allosaccharopolyspora coralli TaxID=2665642 RepID=A0A5Q3Q3T3_9PSEU|nr:serine/threonine-protein kinase [Allosaccharopolyspora coralli]QGK68993.1 protein kinase [Allosaccharopolyspora coralli]